MTLYRFGGNQFINCSVPLAFAGRYFIVESDPSGLLVSVVRVPESGPVFEILKNEPRGDDRTRVTKTSAGIITATDIASDRFLYKVRPGSETSIVLATMREADLEARISDRMIQVGGWSLKNNEFDGVGAGVVVREDGSISIDAPIPQQLRDWFAAKP